MTTTGQLFVGEHPRTQQHARATRRVTRAPIPWLADALAVIAGLGLGVLVALVIGAETGGALSSPGGWLIALGRFFGFTGAYLMLIMVVLIARLPILERSVGQDRLLRWHRRIGPWPLSFIGLHVIFITLGYAQMTKVGPLHQTWVFLRNYPDMLAAAVALGLLTMAGLTSIKIARRRMKYETWWVVHLYMYVALSLAFTHQIVTGVMFIGHPLTKAFWIAVWAATAGVVLAYRIALPVLRNLRHQLRVAAVTEEAPGVYSLTLKGKQLDRLPVSGGQFFQWRFLSRDLWWHSHPYSLSAMPQASFMRLTVKSLGDHSGALAHLRPGTRVLIEGPYGAFTRHAITTNRVTLIGAGVGVTPLRALLEDLPASIDVTVLLRASSAQDLVHRDELAALVSERGGQLHELVGPRHRVHLDARTIRRLSPNLALSDVYICGPEGFNKNVVAVARKLGVPEARLHLESFAF